MERVHGVTSQYGYWHTARISLSTAGDLKVWVDRRPVRPVAVPAAVADKPGLLGFATYQFPSPTFANFTVSPGANPSPVTPGAAAGWPAPPVDGSGEYGPTSVAYRAVVPDVWGAQINSLVKAPNGDIVALSNNGRQNPWRNGINALIRSTDGVLGLVLILIMHLLTGSLVMECPAHGVWHLLLRSHDHHV